jgi:hypothetical protein
MRHGEKLVWMVQGDHKVGIAGVIGAQAPPCRRTLQSMRQQPGLLASAGVFTFIKLSALDLGR